MRVLLIDVNCKNSSTGKIVYSLYQNLKKEGHEAAICYGRGDKIDEKNIYKFGINWETYIHAGLARITGLNGYFSFFSTQRLIEYIEMYKPDVIHIHELHAYFVNIFQLLKYLHEKRIPIIWTFHCEYMYTGKCGHSNECEKWKTECKKCPRLKEYPKSIGLDFTSKMFSDKKKYLNLLNFKIVTPSTWLESRVKNSFLCNKNVAVIHNGIDTEKIFRPKDIQDLKKKYNLLDKRIILSVVPNITDSAKGGKFVLELSKKMNKASYYFIIVGAEKTIQYSDNVLIVEKTKNQLELSKWYSMADCFVICSERENFPTTCLEAFACGNPVVGFDTGGAKETVPSPYGQFVEYGDLEKMKEKIEEQIEKKYSKEYLYEIAKKLYSQEMMYENYKKEYRKLINDIKV